MAPINVTLIDGANLLMRSMYATSKRFDQTLLFTAPVGTFIGQIAKYARITYPSKLCLCWDSGSSDFRLNLWPQYKGQRLAAPEGGEDIFEIAKEVAAACGLEQIEYRGVEADDIIAEYVRMYKNDHHVSIISSDKDFSQLLDDEVVIWHPGDPNPLTLNRWIEENGYTPEQYVKIMGLTGDKVDNIPGVGGVGPKTAVKLLEAADWSIGTLIDQQPAEFKKEVLLRNIALVDLRSGYVNINPKPIDWFNPVEGPKDFRWPALIIVLDKYKLRMLKHSIQQGEYWE